MKSFVKFLESTLPAITIGEPKNSFEQSVLDSYDRCRAEALRKYFPMLSDAEIKLLLRDNYLQKRNIRKLLLNNGRL